MFSIFKGFQIDIARDKGTLFFTAIFPTLMVFILGTMLASLDNPDSVIKPIEIAYYIDSEDPYVESTAKRIIDEFDGIEQITFTLSADPSQTKLQLERGEMTSLVVFKDALDIEIYDGLNLIENRAVHSIFTSVTRMYGSMSAISSMAMLDYLAALPEQSSAQIPGPGASALNVAIIDSATADISTLLDGSRVSEKNYGISRTMIDYYAVTMIVMMLFMGSFMSGASAFYDSKKNGTLRRVLVSPLKRSSVFLQYMLSMIPLNLVQIIIVMVFSSTFFGAHYAMGWQLNVLLFAMLFVAGLACSSISLIIGIFIRFNPMVLLMPVMWPLLFLCGTFSKDISIPGVSEYLPPSLIQSAAFDLTLFGKTSSSLAVLLVSLVIVVAAAIVGSLLFNRKEVAS